MGKRGTEASGSEDSGGAGPPVLGLKEESKGTPARMPTGHLSNSKQANQPQTRKQTSKTPGCPIHSEFQINAHNILVSVCPMPCWDVLIHRITCCSSEIHVTGRPVFCPVALPYGSGLWFISAVSFNTIPAPGKYLYPQLPQQEANEVQRSHH